MMKIEFAGPAMPAQDGGVFYRALVDGTTVACHFASEALREANPAFREASAAEQFEASRSRLLGIARNKIEAGQSASGVVQILASDLA
jgi:Protein of unknown function (DUF1488)